MVTIPTLSALYNSVLADLQTEFGVTIPGYGKNFLRAIAAVQAAKLKLYYLAIGKLQKNIFADTADSEASGGTLERFGRVKIGRNPYPATQGQYDITVYSSNGGTVPAGATFKSDDSAKNPGKLFICDLPAGVAIPNDVITVRALEGGTGSRLYPGETLTATAPILAIDSGALYNAENVAPVDAESIEDYRQVVLDSYTLEPQGGASADYRIWGLSVSGVKQIYPYAASGAPNEINVYVEATTSASTDGKGTPTSTMLTNVAANIETDPVSGRGRRPLGVFAVHTLPVVINTVTISINSGGAISTGAQALITTALRQAVNAIRPFIAGADVLANKNDSLSINTIISAILSAVPGTMFSGVTMTVAVGAGSPAAATLKIFDNGNIPYLSTVTYV